MTTILPGADMIGHFEAECQEQPARLRSLFEHYSQDPEIAVALAAFRKAVSPERPLLWLGMGASYCSSLAGSVGLSLADCASFRADAGEWLHYAASTTRLLSGPVYLTTSGESAELVELMRRNLTPTPILVCNESGSSCWGMAEIRFPILGGKERANATKTYLNASAICAILAHELVGRDWKPMAGPVMNAVEISLRRVWEQADALDAFCNESESLEIIARGSALAGAVMGALTVREMSWVRAVAHSGGAFRHGPFLDVNETHSAMVLALGATAELGLKLARECLAKGGRVILVADKAHDLASSRVFSIQIEPLPEPWDALTSILAPQALALGIMRRTGSRYVRVVTDTQ